MESGPEVVHEDVVSLLAVKDAEIAMLRARVTSLKAWLRGCTPDSVGIPPYLVDLNPGCMGALIPG